LIAQLGQVGELPCGVAFMPGNQDGFDVGVVLVERGSADAGLLGDLRHGDPA
jgi:hypothetical protein